MGNFREKLLRFFRGRYGIDELEKFLIYCYIAVILITAVLSFFVRTAVITVMRILSFMLIAYIIWRMMSRSVQMRMKENRSFLSVKNKVFTWFNLQKNKFHDRKTHIYRKCPSCNAVLRLKKIKGSHRAACPRCGTSFEVNVK